MRNLRKDITLRSLYFAYDINCECLAISISLTIDTYYMVPALPLLYIFNVRKTTKKMSF